MAKDMEVKFEEKALKTHSKEIKTKADAYYILACRGTCGHSTCGYCGVMLYSHKGAVDCLTLEGAAINFLGGKVDSIPKAQSFADTFNDLLHKFPTKNPSQWAQAQLEQLAAGKVASNGIGSCETCFFSQMHPSGILWCKEWHNFTLNSGFCHKFLNGVKSE